MRTYYRSLGEVLGSPLAQKASYFQRGHADSHRVLRSTKLEDAVYRDLRSGDDELDALEKGAARSYLLFLH